MVLTRILLLCGCLPGGFGLLTAVAAAADTSEPPTVKIVRLWTSFRDAQSFTRLGQLAQVDDEPGDAIVLRSQPDARDGFYFTIRLRGGPDKAAALLDGQVLLHVVAPDAAQARTFTFPYAAGGQRSVHLLVGITGTDWTYGEVMPLAWKLELVDGAGRVVGGQESFLWRKP